MPATALRWTALVAALLLLAVAATGWLGHRMRGQLAALVRGHEAWTARIEHLELLSRLAEGLSQPAGEAIASGDVAVAQTRLLAGRKAFEQQLTLVQSELLPASVASERQRELDAAVAGIAATAQQMDQAADEICRLLSANQVAQAAATQEPLALAHLQLHRQVRAAAHRLAGWQQQELAQQAQAAEQTQPFEYAAAAAVLLLALGGCLAAQRLIAAWRQMEHQRTARQADQPAADATRAADQAQFETERAAWSAEQAQSRRVIAAVDEILSSPISAEAVAASDQSDPPSPGQFIAWLRPVVELSHSGAGLLLEVPRESGDPPHFRFLAATAPTDDWPGFALREQLRRQGDQLRNPNSLLGAVLSTAEPVVANGPAHDPRRGGLPEGHLPLANFCGLPLLADGRLIGLVGLANRPDGFDAALVAWLRPAVAACAARLARWQLEQQLLRQLSEKRELAVAMPRLRGRRLLLVSAEPELTRQVRGWLEQAEAEVECLERIAQAAAVMRRAMRHGRPFDLAVVDYDALHDQAPHVERLLLLEPCPRLIAISSRQLPLDRQWALTQGFCDYLVRPLVAAQLWSTLLRHLPEPSAAAPRAALPAVALPPQSEAWPVREQVP